MCVVSSGAQVVRGPIPAYEEQRLPLHGARQTEPAHRLLHRPYGDDLLPARRPRTEEPHPAQPVRTHPHADAQQPQCHGDDGQRDAETHRAAGHLAGGRDDDRREQHVRGEQQQERRRTRPARGRAGRGAANGRGRRTAARGRPRPRRRRGRPSGRAGARLVLTQFHARAVPGEAIQPAAQSPALGAPGGRDHAIRPQSDGLSTVLGRLGLLRMPGRPVDRQRGHPENQRSPRARRRW